MSIRINTWDGGCEYRTVSLRGVRFVIKRVDAGEHWGAYLVGGDYPVDGLVSKDLGDILIKLATSY